MWHELDAEFIGEASDFQKFGNAADLDHRGLRMAHGAGSHHLAKLIRRAGVLSRRDVEAALGAHLSQRDKIFRRPDRFFEKHRLSFATG